MNKNRQRERNNDDILLMNKYCVPVMKQIKLVFKRFPISNDNASLLYILTIQSSRLFAVLPFKTIGETIGNISPAHIWQHIPLML